MTVDDTLVSAIRDYKDEHGNNAKKLIFKSRAKGKMSPISIKKIILMMIAADIIGIDSKLIENEETDAITVEYHATLLFESSRKLNLYDDQRWLMIKTK